MISIILREAILVILFSGGPSITMTMTFWKLRSCNAQGMHKAIIRTYWIFTLVLLNFESFRFWKINYLLLLLIYFHFLYPSIIFFQFLFSFRFTLCFLFHSVFIVHLYNTRFCVTVNTHTWCLELQPFFLLQRFPHLGYIITFLKYFISLWPLISDLSQISYCITVVTLQVSQIS